MTKCFLCKIKLNDEPLIMAYIDKGELKKKHGNTVFAQICSECAQSNLRVKRFTIRSIGKPMKYERTDEGIKAVKL